MPNSTLTRIPAALATLVILSIPCAADPTSDAKLPDDGAWASYQINHRLTNGSELRYKLRISLVGTEMDAGERCRWIEFVESEMAGDPKSTGVHRVLLSERVMLTSQNPFEHAGKYETRFDDGPVENRQTHLAGLFGYWGLFLPGTLAHSQKLAEAKAVQYQRGDLEIKEGRRGKHVWKRIAKSNNQTQTWTFDYALWLHDQIPFGFAHAKVKLVGTLETGETFRTDTFEFSLEDAGTGGKSALAAP